MGRGTGYGAGATKAFVVIFDMVDDGGEVSREETGRVEMWRTDAEGAVGVVKGEPKDSAGGVALVGQEDVARGSSKVLLGSEGQCEAEACSTAVGASQEGVGAEEAVDGA